MTLAQQFQLQRFKNGYQLIDGVQMHDEQGDRFQIENPWFKKYTNVGHFVEVRIDSDRFSAHPDAPEQCQCEFCNETATKPVLCHQEPASFVHIPKQTVPSRGWGEQFWVRVTARQDDYLRGEIDNTLYESRLHGLNRGDVVFFHEDHILVVHGVHREEIVLSMIPEDFEHFGQWVMSQKQ